MAGRYSKFSSGRLFVPSLLAAQLALTSAGTAIAASGLAPCDDAIGGRHEVPASELHATNISHEVEAEALAPAQLDTSTTPVAAADYAKTRTETDTTAETALLRVYDESTEASNDEASPVGRAEGNDDEQPLIKARMPGVSDGDLARYKRQMYRRDI